MMQSGMMSPGILDEFSVMAYAQKNVNTVQFLQNRFQDTFANASNILTDAGRTFFETSRKAFEYVTGAEAVRFSNGVLRKVKNMFQRNEFRELDTVAEVQQSPQVMHRWLMAQENLRTLYLDQRCCGFEGTYQNLDGNDVGREHRDWRLLNDGLVRDDAEHGWVQSYFCDAREERPAVDYVNADMKFTVSSAWDLIAGAIEVGDDDPSSPFGDKL
jgi:hypothetical protein